MLLYFSFIYFLIILFIAWQKEKRFSTSVFLAATYVVTSLFAIMVNHFKIMSIRELSFSGVFVFCLLITMGVLPFLLVPDRCYSRPKPLLNDKPIRVIAWISFLYFLLFLILSLSSIIRVLTGDIAEMRMNVYSGDAEDTWMSFLPPAIAIPVRIINSFFGCPWIYILLGFYAMVIQRMPRKYYMMLLVSSLMGPIRGIIGVDRSVVTYWILSLVAIYLFFKPWMDENQTKNSKRIGIVLLSLAILYLGLVTTSRFEEHVYSNELSGASGGIIGYLGQNIINFAWFYDHYPAQYTSAEQIFPFTYKFIIGTPFGDAVSMQKFLTWQTGIRTGVFYSYLGAMLISVGKTGMYLYCIGLFIISNILCGVRKGGLLAIYCRFIVLFVIMLGLFGHYYSAASRTFSVVAFFFVIRAMERRGLESQSW